MSDDNGKPKSLQIDAKAKAKLDRLCGTTLKLGRFVEGLIDQAYEDAGLPPLESDGATND